MDFKIYEDKLKTFIRKSPSREKAGDCVYKSERCSNLPRLLSLHNLVLLLRKYFAAARTKKNLFFDYS